MAGDEMNRILIIACSQRKRSDVGLLSAIDRYDGPAFKVLRKYLRENEEDLTVYVLSAKYGLIPSDHKIPDYDVRLSRDIATELKAQVKSVAEVAFRDHDFDAVGICVSKHYNTLLDTLTEELGDVQQNRIDGGQGPRLTALKRWLLKTT